MAFHPSARDFDNSLSAAEGGPVRVEQPTAQQAPVVANCQFKDFDTDEETRQRHKAGVEDFQSGAALFVHVDDDDRYVKTPMSREREQVQTFIKPEEHAQGEVFSCLEVPYRQAVRDHPGDYPYPHLYKKVRFFGFADTEIGLQTDHTRNSTASFSVINRVSGDKTTVNTGLFDIEPGTYVCWFAPNDRVLEVLHPKHEYYPWRSGPPPPHTHKWRAILMPVFAEVVALDPSCLQRVVGFCIRPSKRNCALTLCVGSRPTKPGIFRPNSWWYRIFEAGAEVINEAARRRHFGEADDADDEDAEDGEAGERKRALEEVRSIASAALPVAGSGLSSGTYYARSTSASGTETPQITVIQSRLTAGNLTPAQARALEILHPTAPAPQRPAFLNVLERFGAATPRTASLAPTVRPTPVASVIGSPTGSVATTRAPSRMPSPPPPQQPAPAPSAPHPFDLSFSAGRTG